MVTADYCSGVWSLGTTGELLADDVMRVRVAEGLLVEAELAGASGYQPRDCIVVSGRTDPGGRCKLLVMAPAVGNFNLHIRCSGGMPPLRMCAV